MSCKTRPAQNWFVCLRMDFGMPLELPKLFKNLETIKTIENNIFGFFGFALLYHMNALAGDLDVELVTRRSAQAVERTKMTAFLRRMGLRSSNGVLCVSVYVHGIFIIFPLYVSGIY